MRLSMIVAVMASLAACTGSQLPDPPGPLTIAPSYQIAYASLTAAPGDTLPYTLTWGAGTRATGYQVTVTSTGTGWTGLPTAAPQAATSYALKAINVAGWDTTTFTATVYSTNAFGKSKTPATATWKVQRLPGAPGPIGVDSSQVQLSVIVKPDSVSLAQAGVQQFCAFHEALDGHIRMTMGQDTVSTCRAFYDAFPASQRLPGYPIATVHKSVVPYAVEVHLAFSPAKTKGWVLASVR